jgi:PAS domain S-box-containing protein
MTNKDNRPGATRLRARAEKMLEENSALLRENIEALSPEQTRRVLHELYVHQIELEMQNEELLRAQAELDTARARYFDLYDLAPVGYCTVSEKGLILEANLAATTLLGVGRGALVQQPMSRFILKEDQDIFYLHRKALVETDEPQSFELRMVNEDGVERWVHLVATTLQDGDPPVYRVVMSDITERKRSENALVKVNAELENQRLRLAAVMAVLPTGVAITDATGATVHYNQEFERIWAIPISATLSFEEYSTKKAWWADTGNPVAREEWASAQAVREKRPVVGQMLEIQRFDGSRTFVINSAAPILDVNNNIFGTAVAVQDITKLRTANLHIQELNNLLREHVTTLEAVNKELESYSQSVSHDLRTPLRFVNRIAHVLLHERGARLSDGASQQVEMIIQATSEMAKMIENLLMFSQAGREPLKKRRVNVRRLFQEVVKEQRYAQADRGIDIVIQDLPSCLGDRLLLKDVVMNLLDNAIKFSRRSDRPRITIGYTESNSGIAYFVQDNGVGFDMRDSDALFAPFQRLHKADDFEGTGIGLALVKRIVDRHGGRIWAESEVAKGATFYFTLGKEKET